MKRAEASSYFAVEILGNFGHVIMRYLRMLKSRFKLADIECCKQSTNKLALACFILKVNMCENLQKQQNKVPYYFEWNQDSEGTSYVFLQGSDTPIASVLGSATTVKMPVNGQTKYFYSVNGQDLRSEQVNGQDDLPLSTSNFELNSVC